MAEVKITINGVICDMYGRTISGPVKIVGEAMYTDLGVGGGPMPPGPGGGGSPPGIWGGGNQPFPTPPIANVPGIDNPDLPSKPPEPIAPPIDWKVVWHPTEGWLVVGVPNVPHPAPG